GIRNLGLISLLPGAASPVLTVIGDYVAGGGVLLMDAALAPQGGPAQPAALKVTGNVTGAKDVFVFNTLSFGSPNGEDYLQLAEVGGSSGENFVLGQRVNNGAYEYALNRRAD